MKKLRNILVMFLIAIFSCSALVACGKDDDDDQTPATATWQDITKEQVNLKLANKTKSLMSFKITEVNKQDDNVLSQYTLQSVQIGEDIVSIFEYTDSENSIYFDLYASTDKVYVNKKDADGNSVKKMYSSLSIILYDYVNTGFNGKYVEGDFEEDILNQLTEEEKAQYNKYKAEYDSISEEMADYLNIFIPLFMKKNVKLSIDLIETTNIQIKESGTNLDLKYVEDDYTHIFSYVGNGFSTLTSTSSSQKIVNNSVVNKNTEFKLESKSLVISLPDDLDQYEYSQKN